jgi:hypothetical protein
VAEGQIAILKIVAEKRWERVGGKSEGVKGRLEFRQVKR